MKRIIILATLLVASVAIAAPQYHEFAPIATGTNSSGSSTLALSGYIDAVYVSVADGVSTGTVAVSYVPAVGTNAVNIATNAVIGEDLWRPVVDRTSVAGVALTGDDPAPFVVVGETITFSVSSSPTGATWRCLLVTEDGK